MIKLLILFIWIIVLIIVFCSFCKKEDRDWRNGALVYKGNKTLEFLDARINQCREVGSIQWGCGLINRMYGENDYSLEDMLARRHIVKNKLKFGETTRELVIAGATALLLPFIPELFGEGEFPIILRLGLYILALFFFVFYVRMDYFKPKLNPTLVLYDYENKILSERIERAQRKAWNGEMGSGYCEE